ncbi:MAG: septum site-determining protein MinC [Firmicutes bacterium]|nr:septum site-determining protein MinC [Candidatus Fermentithermobacillaceae bacterium]
MNLNTEEILDIQNAVFSPYGLKIKKVVHGSRDGVLRRRAAGLPPEGSPSASGTQASGSSRVRSPYYVSESQASCSEPETGLSAERLVLGPCVTDGSIDTERKEALYREVSRKLLEGVRTRASTSVPTERPSSGVEPRAERPRPVLETLLYRGTVRSGQRVYHPGNLVILGDVNPGGVVQAGGDIVVMGTLRGVAHAGAGGDVDSAIYALRLEPTQIRIANVIGRPPEGEERGPWKGPETARLKDGAIIIEAMDNTR